MINDLKYQIEKLIKELLSLTDKETILELEESLVLCYTGTSHDSGNIHKDQKEQTKNEINEINSS